MSDRKAPNLPTPNGSQFNLVPRAEGHGAVLGMLPGDAVWCVVASCLEICTGFIYEQTNLMSDIWQEHGKAKKHTAHLLVLLSNNEIWLNINTHFFILGPYSNTSYYSSFYLQNFGKTAKCSCWLKMRVISDLPVEPPKNCALLDPPHGV